MDCDEDGASDIFQEEAAAFLMGGNEAMDASVAKRTASDLLGHLQRSKKLRLVQPAQAGRSPGKFNEDLPRHAEPKHMGYGQGCG